MTSDAILIRPMTAADIPTVVGWMLETPLWQRYGISREGATRQFEQALAADDWLLTADIGDFRAIGMAWCVPDGAFSRSPYLRLIGVRPDRSGVGIGGALLRTVERHALEASADHLLLLVSDFNESAQFFYRRLGYVQVGALPGYVVPDVAELIYYKRLKPWNSNDDDR